MLPNSTKRARSSAQNGRFNAGIGCKRNLKNFEKSACHLEIPVLTYASCLMNGHENLEDGKQNTKNFKNLEKSS